MSTTSSLLLQLSHFHNVVAGTINQCEKEIAEIGDLIPYLSNQVAQEDVLAALHGNMTVFFHLHTQRIRVPNRYRSLVETICEDNAQELSLRRLEVSALQGEETLQKGIEQLKQVVAISTQFLHELRVAVQNKSIEDALVQYANLCSITR